MKIGPLDNSTAISPALGDRKASAPTHGHRHAEPSTQVALSDTVASLKSGTAEGVFDTAKVERISGAIREGRFTINPEAIADKLIVNAQELLGTVQPR